ncbi:hypothetical protein [Acinetobacter populi]|uniref:Uncharacterized protein n=1 Tax=Acinetobacter populi TaxID=1582270 RepID=A0A1Z9Z152_9GAMM|nr:hypothetical protein [Acinetobacter populi]OUY08211.1 hypothetical protein CAP51_00900 [Acinetobacter populi]
MSHSNQNHQKKPIPNQHGEEPRSPDHSGHHLQPDRQKLPQPDHEQKNSKHIDANQHTQQQN